MKEDEMDMACSTHGREIKYKSLVKNLGEGNIWETRRIILIHILKMVDGCGLNSSG
jgi:hypothetical protein